MSVKYKIRGQHGLNYLACSIVGWVNLFSRRVYRDMVLDSWRRSREWLLSLVEIAPVWQWFYEEGPGNG